MAVAAICILGLQGATNSGAFAAVQATYYVSPSGDDANAGPLPVLRFYRDNLKNNLKNMDGIFSMVRRAKTFSVRGFHGNITLEKPPGKGARAMADRDEINRQEYSTMSNWCGPLYASRKDSRIVVPKRKGLPGITVNFAKPLGIMIHVVIIVILTTAVVSGYCALFGR
jgi:hypothetical protein